MQGSVITIKRGQKIDRNDFLRKLVDALYVRNDLELNRGEFRVKGDTVDIAMAYSDGILRVTFWDDEIDDISELEATTYHHLESFDEISHIGGVDILLLYEERYQTVGDAHTAGVAH